MQWLTPNQDATIPGNRGIMMQSATWQNTTYAHLTNAATRPTLCMLPQGPHSKLSAPVVVRVHLAKALDMAARKLHLPGVAGP